MSNVAVPVEAVPVSISSRSVTIKVINQTKNYTLTNPKVWQYSGHVNKDPTGPIKPMESEVSSFIKTRGTAAGCVGVLTYESKKGQSKNCEMILAIMFSVPFDYNLFSNRFAVGIYGNDRTCNRGLFNDMYYNNDSNGNNNSFVRRKAGSQINYEGHPLNMTASMPDVASTILTVELREEVGLISRHNSLEGLE